jgi:hypothetical protein
VKMEPGILALIWVVQCARCDARKLLPVDDPLAVMQKSEWREIEGLWHCPICTRMRQDKGPDTLWAHSERDMSEL